MMPQHRHRLLRDRHLAVVWIVIPPAPGLADASIVV